MRDSIENNNIELNEHTKEYLLKKIRVLFETNAPNEDHDGGSAAYDLNLKYSWKF